MHDIRQIHCEVVDRCHIRNDEGCSLVVEPVSSDRLIIDKHSATRSMKTTNRVGHPDTHITRLEDGHLGTTHGGRLTRVNVETLPSRHDVFDFVLSHQGLRVHAHTFGTPCVTISDRVTSSDMNPTRYRESFCGICVSYTNLTVGRDTHAFGVFGFETNVLMCVRSTGAIDFDTTHVRCSWTRFKSQYIRRTVSTVSICVYR